MTEQKTAVLAGLQFACCTDGGKAVYHHKWASGTAVYTIEAGKPALEVLLSRLNQSFGRTVLLPGTAAEHATDGYIVKNTTEAEAGKLQMYPIRLPERVIRRL